MWRWLFGFCFFDRLGGLIEVVLLRIEENEFPPSTFNFDFKGYYVEYNMISLFSQYIDAEHLQASVVYEVPTYVGNISRPLRQGSGL